MSERKLNVEEKNIKALSGLIGIIICFGLIILGTIIITISCKFNGIILGTGIFLGIIAILIGLISFAGLKVINPNEALVLTLFGNYYGTLTESGFFWVNPFVTAINPTYDPIISKVRVGKTKDNLEEESISIGSKKISLKTMTLNNNHQKVNDELGNPIIVGAVVIWRVVNPTKAVFNVDNFKTFLSIQCDSTIRNIVRLYPYDIADVDEKAEKSLRGSSTEVANRCREELQSRVECAGIEVEEVRITHLAYAPEIAAAMLQRQQAEAIIAARKKIVEGAVGMVEMALNTLEEGKLVELDDEKKAAMVSNLLVVLCGNKDAQPIVNSGNLY